jgi:hypothetical protein
VRAAEHDELVAQLDAERGRLERLSGMVRRLAWVTPHEGEWDRSRSTLQAEARALLAELVNSAPQSSHSSSSVTAGLYASRTLNGRRVTAQGQR